MTSLFNEMDVVQLRCVCHTLDLTFKDCLKVKSVKSFFDDIRCVVGHFNKSVQSTELL